MGDLESDTEDLLVTRDEFSGRLRDSFDKMGKINGEIGELKNTLDKQNIEMEILRTQLLQGRGVHNTYITQGYQSPSVSELMKDLQPLLFYREDCHYCCS